MEVYYCGQCRMMIAPQAHFCSVCGSVVHPRRSWVRKTWPHIAWILQRVVAIYVVWVALRIGSPVALIVTPDCVATPARVGIAMRVMGKSAASRCGWWRIVVCGTCMYTDASVVRGRSCPIMGGRHGTT